MSGGWDGHFRSTDTDRWCYTLCCRFSLNLHLHRNFQICSWTHKQAHFCSSWTSKFWINQTPCVKITCGISSLTCLSCLLFTVLKLFQQTLCFTLCMRGRRGKKMIRRRVGRFSDWRWAFRSLFNRRNRERDRRPRIGLCLRSTGFFNPYRLKKWQQAILSVKIWECINNITLKLQQVLWFWLNDHI